MKPTKHFRLGAGLALAVALIAGCGSSSEAPASPDPAAQDGADVDASGPRTVTDMAGREVTLPAEITSIGTFGSIGVLNAFVQLMGAGDKIVNEMSANFTQTDQWRMQYEFSPQIAGGPLFEEAGEVVVETVLETSPDVAFTMTQATASVLENVGVPTVYLEWQDVEDVKDAVVLMGEVLGEEERAQEYLAYFDAQQAKAAELTADLAEEDRTTVLYGDPIQFRQPHVIAEWWITQGGGTSVTDIERRGDESFEYTMEDLLAWDPEVLILTRAQLRDEIAANSNYDNITAVREDAMHVIPTVAHVWGNRTVEQPLTVLWTTHQLYPELLPREDLAEEIRGFYSTFFGYEMSDDDIDAIIDG